MAVPELKRILVVEDDPDIRFVASMALEVKGGFTLQMCSSGAEALDAIPIFRPDLILLDVMMPKMDGPATLTRMRQLPETRDTVVLFMTAKVQPQEVASYKKLGAVEVIFKPFNPLTLAHRIRDIWAGHYGNIM